MSVFPDVCWNISLKSVQSASIVQRSPKDDNDRRLRVVLVASPHNAIFQGVFRPVDQARNFTETNWQMTCTIERLDSYAKYAAQCARNVDRYLIKYCICR